MFLLLMNTSRLQHLFKYSNNIYIYINIYAFKMLSPFETCLEDLLGGNGGFSLIACSTVFGGISFSSQTRESHDFLPT